MKRATILLVSILFMSMMAAALHAQDTVQNKVDVSGIWVGVTDFPNTPEQDEVTLVLKKQGTSFSGTITVGKQKDITCNDLIFSDEDSFGFTFVLSAGDSKTKITVKLDYSNDKVMGTKLMGSWYLESGEYGLMDLNPEK